MPIDLNAPAVASYPCDCCGMFMLVYEDERDPKLGFDGITCRACNESWELQEEDDNANES